MAKKQPKDELDQLAEGDAKNVIALLLWKARHRNPEMSEQITPHDLKGFRECVDYLKVVPDVRIVRPQGRPAQSAIPAAGARRAVSGYPAEPPRPFVVVSLVEKGTENMIRPVENNVEDNEKRILAQKVQQARSGAEDLCARIEADMRGHAYSDSTIQEALASLRLLAKG